VLLLNTDADADPQRLARFVEAAERLPDAAVLGPRIVDEHGKTQRSTWRRHLPRHYLPDALFLNRLLSEHQPDVTSDVDCVSGCVFLIRRDVLAEVGAFDERFFMYFEEADLCERVRRRGHRVVFVPDVAFVHIGGLSAAQSAERTFVAFRESALLYHAVWHGRFWTEYVRACLVLGCVLRLAIWSTLALFGRGGRAGLYHAALARLLRPGLVGELCRRPRELPKPS
jgi:GT2 family glycosyltransferase